MSIDTIGSNWNPGKTVFVDDNGVPYLLVSFCASPTVTLVRIDPNAEMNHKESFGLGGQTAQRFTELKGH